MTCQGPLGKGTSSALLCPQDEVPPWGAVPTAKSGHGEDRQGTLTGGGGESLSQGPLLTPWPESPSSLLRDSGSAS